MPHWFIIHDSPLTNQEVALRSVLGVATLFAAAIVVSVTVSAQQPGAAPAFTSGGELQRPLDYREWVFLSSGLDMTYGPAAATLNADRQQLFNNVFVTRDAYREFLRSGTWPDRTMFILEVRQAQANVSINNRGRTQGSLAAIEAAVKDVRRFKATGGWGYFGFGDGTRATGSQFGADAGCNACHAANTAVDNTFVQFYPELLAVAKTKGTIKASYDPNKKP
jgi:hypothetical protein